jgi:hypothetical protein
LSARRHRAIVAAGIALGLVAAGVAALVAATWNSAPALRPPGVAPAAASPFPAPPRGAVVFARQDRSDVLALAAVPKPGGILLRVSVIGPQGKGVRGLRVRLAAGERAAKAAIPCGAGCYQAVLALRRAPRVLRVIVARPSRATTWSVGLPVPWPARDASALIARAARVWTHLRSLSYLDRLSSDPVHTVVSHWRIVAPDRLAYEIEGGGRAVVIGAQRWDRSAGGGWVKSRALRLHQPKPFWVAATDAHVVGAGRIGSHPVWRVSFFDPRTPGWLLVSIDKRTARTLDVRMWAAAHFMHDTYGQFNAPLRIIPPG